VDIVTAARAGFTTGRVRNTCSGGKSHERSPTVLALWLIVLALVLFAVIGGVAIAKFLFLVLIAAAILALIGLFTRTA